MATPQVWGHNPTGSVGVMAAKSILRRRPAPTIMYTYLDELVVPGVLSGPQKENPPKRSLKERNSLAPMISSSTQLLKLSIIVYYREERKERK